MIGQKQVQSNIYGCYLEESVKNENRKLETLGAEGRGIYTWSGRRSKMKRMTRNDEATSEHVEADKEVRLASMEVALTPVQIEICLENRLQAPRYPRWSTRNSGVKCSSCQPTHKTQS